MREDIKKRIETVRHGEVPEGYITENHQLRPAEWKYEKIGKYLVPYDEFSNDTETYPLATSSRQGLMLQSEYYNDQRYEETSGGFHVVPEGYVTYRHMSDDDIFRFNVNRMGGPVLVSPEYPVFTTSEDIHQDMLIAYLNNMKEFTAYCSAQKKGSTRTRMYFSRLGEFAMPIPPITEQQKIADILTTCDRVIELKQQLLEEKRRQKQWLMQKLLDPNSGVQLPGFKNSVWKKVVVGEECDMFSGGTPKAGKDEYYVDGTIPFIRSGEIASDVTELFLTNEGYGNSSAKMVDAGDLLYALYGANSGDCAISKIHGAINQAILCIKPKHMERIMLYYLLCANKGRIISTYLQGGQGNLSAEIIKKLVVEIPTSNTHQKKIIEILSAADKDIESCESELVAWQQKKKALMQLLLTGLVRV